MLNKQNDIEKRFQKVFQNGTETPPEDLFNDIMNSQPKKPNWKLWGGLILSLLLLSSVLIFLDNTPDEIDETREINTKNSAEKPTVTNQEVTPEEPVDSTHIVQKTAPSIRQEPIQPQTTIPTNSTEVYDNPAATVDSLVHNSPLPVHNDVINALDSLEKKPKPTPDTEVPQPSTLPIREEELSAEEQFLKAAEMQGVKASDSLFHEQEKKKKR